MTGSGKNRPLRCHCNALLTNFVSLLSEDGPKRVILYFEALVAPSTRRESIFAQPEINARYLVPIESLAADPPKLYYRVTDWVWIVPYQLTFDTEYCSSKESHSCSLFPHKPTVQSQKYAIPIIVSGRDLMACAQTGSGKTVRLHRN